MPATIRAATGQVLALHARKRPRAPLVVAQGAYLAATGAWPLVHLRSFEALLGPKPDDGLVRVVGLLAIAIGAALLAGARGAAANHGVRVLAGASAAAFLFADLAYGMPQSGFYLLDAFLQAGFLFAAIAIAVPRPHARRPAGLRR